MPRDPLGVFIAHFWSVSWDVPEPVVAETLPHPSVHVVIEGERAEVGGVSTKRFTRTLEGKGRVFGIKFRPGMFGGFLGDSVSTLSNRVVPIEKVFGAAGRAFAEEIANAQSGEQRMALAEAFFSKRMPTVNERALHARDLVERMERDRGLINVDQVSALAGMNTRTLQRDFKHFVGASPKWVLQRYRLHEASARLEKDPTLSSVELALELGYTDQPHFVRDFKAVVGKTPGAYVKSLRERAQHNV